MVCHSSFQRCWRRTSARRGSLRLSSSSCLSCILSWCSLALIAGFMAFLSDEQIPDGCECALAGDSHAVFVREDLADFFELRLGHDDFPLS